MKDLARIYVKGGDGGSGKVSFRREYGVPKGGPDGGDGGRGADVTLVADENITSLLEFNFKKRFVGEDGEGGMGKKMYGKDRAELVVPVPVGTEVYEIEEQLSLVSLRERPSLEEVIGKRKLLVDMKSHRQRYTIAYGGRGGRGNDHFKSSTNQTPMEREEGERGEERWLLLELKVVANVGIIGLPNVGKSSLLKALTRANPRIAGYPFTTLEPNLGVLELKHQAPSTKNQKQSLILVDVPGVVEQAWEGRGIGPWFLRHLERTKTLLHVLAPTAMIDGQWTMDKAATQLATDYQVVRRELEKYGRGLPEKKEIVVVNKMELVADDQRPMINEQFRKSTGKELVWVSAGMGEVGGVRLSL